MRISGVISINKKGDYTTIQQHVKNSYNDGTMLFVAGANMTINIEDSNTIEIFTDSRTIKRG